MRRRWSLIALALATMALATVLVVVGTASAAYEFYLKIDGIKGEVTQSGHENWIQFASYSHHIPGMPSATVLLKYKPRITHGKHVNGDLVLTRRLDEISPLLLRNCTEGTRMPLLRFEARGGEGEQPGRTAFVLHDCVISGLTVRAPGFGDRKTPFGVLPLDQPVEEITLHYGSLEWTYTPGNIKDM
jgi:type VI secretion system secreted protein Hcp